MSSEHRLRAAFQIATLAVVGLAGMAYATASDEEHQLKVEEPVFAAPYVEHPVFPTAAPTLDLTWFATDLSSPNWTPTPLPTATPAPVRAVSAPVYESYFYSDEELKGMMRQAGFYEDSLDWWVRVIRCESHGDPNALGGYDPWIVQYEATRRVPGPGLYIGLLQVDAALHQGKAESEYGPNANLMNPVVNLRVGLIISGGYPTSAWPYCSKV